MISRRGSARRARQQVALLGQAASALSEPWRSGCVESFNSRIRDECLNINSFWSLTHARVVIGDWKHDYNHHRRHSALGYLTPARYAATCTHQ
jgi:putative transposase